MMEKQSKNSRILDMYVRLCEGKVINKKEEAMKFQVDQRSIQRDIEDIRAFLHEKIVRNEEGSVTISYDRKKKGFILVGRDNPVMSNSEMLAVCKILLESRAFTQKEIRRVLDKLIIGCTSQEDKKIVNDLIANERYHYVEVHNKSCIEDKLWELGNVIKQGEIVEITYKKQFAAEEVVKRNIAPVSILFSEYYFYLNAYIVDKKEKGYEKLYDYPTTFRVDRILYWKAVGMKFRKEYASRFEEGEFRKRVQFMYAGDLIRCQFKYTGGNVEAIQDRLPTAKIRPQTEGGYMVEAEVYGKGILMWLLSQGKAVEVLKPASLREEMKDMLQEILLSYQE